MKTVIVTAKDIVYKTELMSLIEKAKIEFMKIDVFTKDALEHLEIAIYEANTVVNNYEVTEQSHKQEQTVKNGQSIKTGDHTMVLVLWFSLIMSMFVGKKILKKK